LKQTDPATAPEHRLEIHVTDNNTDILTREPTARLKLWLFHVVGGGSP